MLGFVVPRRRIYWRKWKRKCSCDDTSLTDSNTCVRHTMTAEQLMESQKFFAASNNTITCCCCGGTTIAAAGVCNHCRIPLVVSQSSEDRGIRPGIIPVLGGSGAGKTVYIGMLLDILSKRSHSITGQPNNAFSVAVQQRTVASLERRRF